MVRLYSTHGIDYKCIQRLNRVTRREKPFGRPRHTSDGNFEIDLLKK